MRRKFAAAKRRRIVQGWLCQPEHSNTEGWRRRKPPKPKVKANAFAFAFTLVEEDGFAFLRKSHGGCGAPPAPRQEPPFEYIRYEKTATPMGSPFSGGGGWIRTIEGEASRFTVCPLWPLGYSSIFSWAEEGGAGGRIRTPDLLITNQLLYQLSYTSTEGFHVHNGAYYSSEGRVCQQFFEKRTEKGEEAKRRNGE